MVCALCGEKINGDGSMDHVFPRALYKWNEKLLSDEEYAKLESFINMK